MVKFWKRHYWWTLPFLVAVASLIALGTALDAAPETRMAFAAEQANLSPTNEVTNDETKEDTTTRKQLPADDFIAKIRQLEAKEWATKSLAVNPLPGGPKRVVPTCMDLPEETPTYTLGLSRSNNDGVSLTLITTPAGYGPDTVRSWRQTLGTCTQTHLSYSTMAHPTQTEAFTATTATGQSHTITHVVWARGDVVVAVATSAPVGTSRLQKIIQKIDTTVTKALQPFCVDTAATTADATRNPDHPDYAGYLIEAEVKAQSELPLPQLRTAQARRWERPQPEEVPHLAPLMEFDADRDSTDVANAPRQDPPVLVDVENNEPPPPVDPPQSEPIRPELPPTSVTYEHPKLDTDGPGCGWEFLGQEPPPETAKEIAKAKIEATQQAQSTLVRQRRLAWVSTLAWVARWEAWKPTEVEYQHYEQDQQWWQLQVERFQDATQSYEQSKTQWEEAQQNTPEPDPSPDQDPEPDDPAGEDPDDDPSQPGVPGGENPTDDRAEGNDHDGAARPGRWG